MWDRFAELRGVARTSIEWVRSSWAPPRIPPELRQSINPVCCDQFEWLPGRSSPSPTWAETLSRLFMGRWAYMPASIISFKYLLRLGIGSVLLVCLLLIIWLGKCFVLYKTTALCLLYFLAITYQSIRQSINFKLDSTNNHFAQHYSSISIQFSDKYTIAQDWINNHYHWILNSTLAISCIQIW